MDDLLGRAATQSWQSKTMSYFAFVDTYGVQRELDTRFSDPIEIGKQLETRQTRNG